MFLFCKQLGFLLIKSVWFLPSIGCSIVFEPLSTSLATPSVPQWLKEEMRMHCLVKTMKEYEQKEIFPFAIFPKCVLQKKIIQLRALTLTRTRKNGFCFGTCWFCHNHAANCWWCSCLCSNLVHKKKICSAVSLRECDFGLERIC